MSKTLKEFRRWLCRHYAEQRTGVDVKGTKAAKIFRWSVLVWSRNLRKLEGPGDEQRNGKREKISGELEARTHGTM